MENSPELSNAVSQLTLNNIFFTALYYSLKVERDDDLTQPDGSPGIACTDGVRFIYRADTFKSMFSDKERVSVLAHELLHVILYHPLRRGIRDPLLWNVACDHAVNLLLSEYRFAIGKGWLCDKQYQGMSAEQIYDKLQSAAEQGGGKKGKPQLGNGPGQDVQDYDPTEVGNEGKSKADVERAIGVATEQALQCAKAAGQLSAGMKRMINDAQVVREPWYQHLRRHMNSAHSRQYNWVRLDRRRAAAFGVVAPEMRTEALGHIIVGIDCSGSISTEQISAMGAHLSDIARECDPKSITVLYFDTKITNTEVFEGPEWRIELSPHGGGGTDFRPVFAAVDQSDAQVLIMFTDMYGPWGVVDPAVPVIWVTPTTHIAPPFGEIIFADFND